MATCVCFAILPAILFADLGQAQQLVPDLRTLLALVCTGLTVMLLIAMVAVLAAQYGPNRPRSAVPGADRGASRPCQLCGIELPPNAPQGLCPRCLLHAAIDEPRIPASPSTVAYSQGAAAMAPQELANHFPQLEIVALLGKGGMGAVYKARQRHLDRFVALKILPPETASDPAFAERFTREARALARLNHPNIVGVHDFGESGGLYWLLMEYVDGVNLRQAMHAGRLTPEEALRIVPQLCDALQFAHDEGIVHRDIKPENILLDTRGRVKVADFGLAKILGQSAGAGTLTGTQQVVGTIHYMAPEQLAGARAVDHRADIYSLGVTFYEMLTGELPLGRFPPPSKSAGVDARLDPVVLRTLEREPDERFQHASDVRTAIAVIAGHPPPAAEWPARTGVRRRADTEAGSSTEVRDEIQRAGFWLRATGIAVPVTSCIVAVVCCAVSFIDSHSGAVPVGWGLFYIVWSMVAGPVILAGARALRRVRSPGVALLGVLVAMVPITPAILLGLPVGVWCLTLLCRHDVREELQRGTWPGKEPLAWRQRNWVARLLGAMIGSRAIRTVFWSVACVVLYVVVWAPDIGVLDRWLWPYQGMAESALSLEPARGKPTPYRRLAVTEKIKIRRQGRPGPVRWMGDGPRSERVQHEFTVEIDLNDGSIRRMSIKALDNMRWQLLDPAKDGRLIDGAALDTPAALAWMHNVTKLPGDQPEPDEPSPQLHAQAAFWVELVRQAADNEQPQWGLVINRAPKGRLDRIAAEVRSQWRGGNGQWPFAGSWVGTGQASFEPDVPIVWVGGPVMLAVWGGGLYFLLRRKRPVAATPG